jgi:uncharacterized glyoxalase superfamily protein PhnB
MELVQSRIVTRDVESLARFYATLIGSEVVVNEYYVEIAMTAQKVAFSRERFSDFGEPMCGPPPGVRAGEVILDFATDDLDAQCARADALGVQWAMKPTMQPWGRRSMMFRDPQGHLVSVFSKKQGVDL